VEINVAFVCIEDLNLTLPLVWEKTMNPLRKHRFRKNEL
jgi:hypothetical protein